VRLSLSCSPRAEWCFNLKVGQADPTTRPSPCRRAVGVHKCRDHYRSPPYDRSAVQALVKEVSASLLHVKLIAHEKKGDLIGWTSQSLSAAPSRRTTG
jgi:hypothetical protein